MYEKEEEEEPRSTKKPLPQKRKKEDCKKTKEDQMLDTAMSVLERAKKNQAAGREDADDTFGRNVANGLQGVESKRGEELAKLKIQEILFLAQTGAYDAPPPQQFHNVHSMGFLQQLQSPGPSRISPAASLSSNETSRTSPGHFNMF